MLCTLLRHDGMLVLAGLLAGILLAWGWLLLGAGIEMEQMDMGGGQVMLMAPEWSARYMVVNFLIWAIIGRRYHSNRRFHLCRARVRSLA